MKPVILFLLLALISPGNRALAQITDEYRWIELSPQVSVLQLGSRLTNVGVINAERDLVVDSYLASQADALVDEVALHLGGAPDFVVTTHSHGDHWGANAQFAERGALMIAQRNTLQTMSDESWSIIREQMMPPAPAAALADLVVDDQLVLLLDEQVQLIHLPLAHTGGDLLVWMPGENLLFAGDVLAMGYPTLIDAVNNGSIDGLIDAQQAMLALTDESTRVIPGHGPITDRRALAMSLDFMRGLRAKLGELDRLPDNAESVAGSLPDLGQTSDPMRTGILVRQAFDSMSSRD